MKDHDQAKARGGVEMIKRLVCWVAHRLVSWCRFSEDGYEFTVCVRKDCGLTWSAR